MIDAMGDKASAKATMKAAGVPTIPGSEGILADFEEAKACAHEIGYPIMLKATAGGGGKGMRVCNDDDELAEGWESHAARRVPPLATTACTWRNLWWNPATLKSKSPLTTEARHATSASATAPSNVATRNSWKKPRLPT